MKTISKQMPSRCEWARDDYSLRRETLPKKSPDAGQRALDLE